jgi:hypothetical protein
MDELEDIPSEPAPSGQPPAAGAGNPWLVVGICLVVAALLIALGGLAAGLALDEGTLRQQLVAIAQTSANLPTAILVLAAVLAFIPASRAAAEPRRVRGWFALGFAIGIAVALLSLFSVWDIAFPDDNGIAGAVRPDGWDYKLAQLLPRLAAALLGATATVIATGNAPIASSEAPAVQE